LDALLRKRPDGKRGREQSTACLVRDVIERIPKASNIPVNNLLAVTTDPVERSLISDLVRREGVIRVIPTVATSI
jgi:hypothetical protein